MTSPRVVSRGQRWGWGKSTAGERRLRRENYIASGVYMNGKRLRTRLFRTTKPWPTLAKKLMLSSFWNNQTASVLWFYFRLSLYRIVSPNSPYIFIGNVQIRSFLLCFIASIIRSPKDEKALVFPHADSYFVLHTLPYCHGMKRKRIPEIQMNTPNSS